MTIEFKVISTPKANRFEEEVTKALNENWEMSGAVFVSQMGMLTVAMTKETAAPKVVQKKKTNDS